MSEPPFSIGIEEEYLLVRAETGELESDPPASMLQQCEERCLGQVSPEFMRSQIEIGTKVCTDIKQAREDLARLRGVIIDVAAEHGLAPIASSSHPQARWISQKHTARERYAALASEMQAAARRLLICGMHVHVGIEDDSLRIDLMNQFSYFLPHLLALSCSSPFWEGRDTGLKSYRLTVFDALPRTGLPERFSSYAEYRRHVEILISAGLIEDSSKIWWDLRPSEHYPTLETRVMDVCTYIDDAVSLAALVVCILRMLWRLRLHNQRWRIYTPMLIRENRWRAMRYSFSEGMIDLAKGHTVPFEQTLDELIELIAEDAEALDCVEEIAHLRVIAERGTSAHRQVATFEESLAGGVDQLAALQSVVEQLVRETRAGVR